MVVNGRERWACRTRLSRCGAGPVTVRPLYHFPLLRDLVVDMAPSPRSCGVGAALVPAPAAEPYALIPAGSAGAAGDRPGHRVHRLRNVRVGLHDGGPQRALPGPGRAQPRFTLAARPRDAGRAARWRVLLTDDALARCHGQGNCTEVCPMGLAPTTSIIRLRQMATRRLFGLG